jgi:hypothetical protein
MWLKSKEDKAFVPGRGRTQDWKEKVERCPSDTHTHKTQVASIISAGSDEWETDWGTILLILLDSHRRDRCPDFYLNITFGELYWFLCRQFVEDGEDVFFIFLYLLVHSRDSAPVIKGMREHHASCVKLGREAYKWHQNWGQAWFKECDMEIVALFCSAGVWTQDLHLEPLY